MSCLRERVAWGARCQFDQEAEEYGRAVSRDDAGH